MSDHRWRLSNIDVPRILSDSHGDHGASDVAGVVGGRPR